MPILKHSDQELQTCPRCDGTGREEYFVDKWSDHHGHYTVDKTQPCSMCEATGFIPTPLDFVSAHDDLHQEVADMLDTTPEAAEYLLSQLKSKLND